MLVAALVILAGVVVVASGRGGEMAVAEPDYPPIDLGPVSSADVALLRPPSSAWGYNMRVTDEALEVIAKAVTERDVQIAALQQQVSDLRDQLGGSAEDTAATPGVSITRPQPIYHPGDQGGTADQSVAGDHGADEVQFGPGDQSDQIDQSVRGDVSGYDGGGYASDGEPQTPAEGSAPWGPAEPPEAAPLWEPSHQPATEHAISWEGSPGTAEQAPQAAPWDPGHQVPDDQPAGGEPSGPPASSGWSADPADTSPDATAISEPAAVKPAVETSVPVTPATGWPAQAQDQAQDQARPPDQARPKDPARITWDEDPRQTKVWGAEHARAKAAKAAEETMPSTEQPSTEQPGTERPDDGRG
jgi:hypothetical protein